MLGLRLQKKSEDRLDKPQVVFAYLNLCVTACVCVREIEIERVCFVYSETRL